MSEAKRKIYEFGEFRVDSAKRQLLREGEVVPLYSKAFDLLLLLVENSGSDLSKDQLLEDVWPGQILEEANVAVNISAVRRALGETASQPRYLVTIPGRGYRFIADVREVNEPKEALLIEAETISQITLAEESRDALDTPETETALLILPQGTAAARALDTIRRHQFASAVVVLVVIGSFATGWYLRARKPARVIDSIAVLPFVNASGDPEAEYLSDGLTESIINTFSQLRGLRVVPRSTVFRYKAQQIDPHEIGRQLGVRGVITGRVVERGGKINVQAELIDVDENAEVWGQHYDRGLADLQSVQAEISKQILEKLQLKLSDAQLKENHTPPPEAYQAYLRGSYFLKQEADTERLKAVDAFNQAVQLDPDYALAYAGLGNAYSQVSGGTLSPNEAMSKAKTATLKALAIDGSLAEAHLNLARIYMQNDWDFAGAEQELKRSLELDPNDAANHNMYAALLGCTFGRFAEGEAHMRRALELDPLSINNHSGAAVFYYCARQPDHVIEEANKMIELNPNSRGGRGLLAMAYLLQGRYDAAIEQCQKNNAWFLLGYAYAASGKRDEALKVVAELQDQAQHRYMSPVFFAYIYGAIGDKDRAFEWLEKAYAEHNDSMATIKMDPFIDSLRSDPRFPALLKRIGIPP